MAGPVPKKRNAPASGDSCAAGDGAPAGDQQCPARKRRQMSGMAAAQVQELVVPINVDSMRRIPHARQSRLLMSIACCSLAMRASLNSL